MPNQQRKRRSIEAAGPINRLRLKKRKPSALRRRRVVPRKIKKPSQRLPRSLRAASSTETPVCRYCGSDDLAPSFKKRRDARCRACFKKRYCSILKDKKTRALRRRKPQSSLLEGRIGARVSSRGPGPDHEVVGFVTRSNGAPGQKSTAASFSIPSACSCALQSNGRSIRRVSASTVNSTGWRP